MSNTHAVSQALQASNSRRTENVQSQGFVRPDLQRLPGRAGSSTSVAADQIKRDDALKQLAQDIHVTFRRMKTVMEQHGLTDMKMSQWNDYAPEPEDARFAPFPYKHRGCFTTHREQFEFFLDLSGIGRSQIFTITSTKWAKWYNQNVKRFHPDRVTELGKRSLTKESEDCFGGWFKMNAFMKHYIKHRQSKYLNFRADI